MSTPETVETLPGTCPICRRPVQVYATRAGMRIEPHDKPTAHSFEKASRCPIRGVDGAPALETTIRSAEASIYGAEREVEEVRAMLALAEAKVERAKTAHATLLAQIAAFRAVSGQ